jgi:Uma2 family endonuclease
MTAVTADPPQTLAQLHARVSGLPTPPERIRVRPLPGTATEQDLLALVEREPACRCELVNGTLVEKAVGTPEGSLEFYLCELLSAFVRPRNLGVGTTASGLFRLFAGRVRMPDVAFVSWDRLPGRRRPTDPVWDAVPDLAVEVLSSSNRPGEMLARREDFFSAGVRLVWEIDAVARTVAVFTRADAPDAVLAAPAVLDGGAVLPGFAVPLADLFAELDRHG